jgi:hypothetical protein
VNPSAAPEEAAAPRVLALLPAPGGGEPDRVLRVRFGRFIEKLLEAGVDPDKPGPDGETFAEYLASLGRGADVLHDVLSGHPPLDGDLGHGLHGPHDLAGYFLALDDRDLAAAHSMVGFDADYGLDDHGDRFARMVRLTDYLDPEGHTFDAHLRAVQNAESTEDPGPARELGPEAAHGGVRA